MEYQKMVKPDIIEIYPGLNASVRCILCQSADVNVHNCLFEGIHVLLDCTCQNCNNNFFSTLPIAHDALFPIAFTKDGKRTSFDEKAEVWLAKPLIKAVIEADKVGPLIEKKLYRQHDEAILLNCLDDCFGHVYAKLWNAQLLLEKYPDRSVIVLIPQKMEWLVPHGVAEVWLVDATFRDMTKYISNLDGFLKKEIQRFSRFHLSTAPVFLDTDKIDDEQFLKMRKFDLEHFNQLRPRVTFVLRQDRFWHANKIEGFLHLALIKLKWNGFLKKIFIWRQNMLVKKTIRAVRKQNLEVEFVITGLGKHGSFGSLANDLRVDNISGQTEFEWCEQYAKSHVVIGVHGSNMLIPSSLSAGFIEILPEYKIPHIGEDTIMRYSGRFAMLLGRHVDAFIRPHLLARHVLHMLRFGELYEEIKSNSFKQ